MCSSLICNVLHIHICLNALYINVSLFFAAPHMDPAVVAVTSHPMGHPTSTPQSDPTQISSQTHTNQGLPVSGLITDIFSVITKWFTISIHRQWQFSNVSECVKSKCEWQHDISVWNASTDSHAPRPGKERVDDQAGDNSLEIPTILHLCLFVF